MPWRDYLYNFKPTLFEGKWYYIQDFRLKRATSIPKYSDYVYEIEFMWHTKMWPVSDRSDETSLQFIYADEVESESEDYVTGNLRLIYIVYAFSLFYFLSTKIYKYLFALLLLLDAIGYREGETDYEAKYVTFTIRDNL